MLDFIPQPWRDRIAAAFVIGFFVALLGRKIGAAAIKGGSTSRLARALVELGPGLRAVSTYLPPPARAVYQSLSGAESDPPGADPDATPVPGKGGRS